MDGDTRGLGSRVGDGMGRPSRRLFALGAGAAVLALLVDRGLRLDVPPPPPPVPTRRPAPDEALLLSAVVDLDHVVRAETAALAGPDAGPLVRQLRSVNREQLTVLRGRLTNAGVPTAVIDAALARGPLPASSASTPSSSNPSATTSATGTPTPSRSTAPSAPSLPRTSRELATLLDSIGQEDWVAASTATPGTRELLLSAWSQRLAGAALLGRDVAVAAPSPVRPAIIERTQPLVYAFQVVAAQSTGSQQVTALRTLDALTRLEIAVAGSTSTTPAGWALPHPVTTPAEARRLATETLAAAVEAGTEIAGPRPSPATLEDVARWSADVQAVAADWNVPPTAFPGATA
ncbi:hypothetical protein GCM10009868_29870 [Terrabacter aerolatus]|uniref:DUF4439 domain-containing protein n=1 Tax=Terrabacter aerolatus TaxID=422442 RepID=A0A512CXP3_9MICO|nr:hypothetical protein [Terrabacter aerolatus]GEO28974.1 hypothetical protein TAE01_07840 [Terrabacter aerolatus]